MSAEETLRKLRDACDAASSVDTENLSGDEALLLRQAVAQLGVVHDVVDGRAESELYAERGAEWPGVTAPVLGGRPGGPR